MNNVVCINLSTPREKISETMDNIIFEYKLLDSNKQALIRNAIASGAAMGILFIGSPVQAANIKQVIISRFNPIVDLIQALGYPVCLCTMTMGGVMMAFNRKKGISLIRDGAIAYLVIQFVPMFMQILTGVGDQIK